MQTIPTIDLAMLSRNRDDGIRRIMDACTDIGFLTLCNTGLPADDITAMRRCVIDVFDADAATKSRQMITRDNYRGYIPAGFFTPNDGTGTADTYEGYKLHTETAPDDPVCTDCALYGPNIWPDHVPQSRGVVLRYWAHMERIATTLMGAMAEGLGLAPDTFTAAFVNPLTNMTLLHYPAQAPDDTRFGIHPHKDTDALTIIAPDPVGGLEVQNPAGGWITATAPPGGLIVNIGDMLELWSGGRLKSTPHRVINQSGKARYSFPWFAVPRHDVTVRPLLPPVPGFDRPQVHCGHWSSEVWRTNWPAETARADTPELGTLH